MKQTDIERMAYDILDQQAVESDQIEYKKSAEIKDSILKTACAFANNYYEPGNWFDFCGGRRSE